MIIRSIQNSFWFIKLKTQKLWFYTATKLQLSNNRKDKKEESAYNFVEKLSTSNKFQNNVYFGLASQNLKEDELKVLKNYV